jgi:putative peptidoglycan lipid II flippase
VAAAGAPTAREGRRGASLKPPLVLALASAAQLAGQIAQQLAVLAALGVGSSSDAWVAAQSVPAVLTAIVAMALQSVWQSPLAQARDDVTTWRDLQRTAHAQALLAFALPCLVLAATVWAWAPLLFAGLPPAARQALAEATPALLAAAALHGATAVLTTAQRGRDRLLSAELVGLAATLAALVLAWPVARHAGVQGVAWLALARAAVVWLGLQFLVQGSWPRWQAGLRSAAQWRQMRPLLAGAALYKTAPLVDRFWTSLAAAGSVSLFGLAQSGTTAWATVLEKSLCMPLGPQIARAVGAADAEAARRLMRRALVRVALAGAASLAALLLLLPVWNALLGAVLALDAARAFELWLVCALLLGFVFVAAAGTAVVAVFYALGDTRTPALIGSAGFVLGLVAKAVGFLSAGLPGLAAATSLYYLFNLSALVHFAWRGLDRLEPVSAPGAATPGR